VQIAEKAGIILNQIFLIFKKTSELVQEISASCNEQNTGAEHINKALLQLDLVIQQNAQVSEELSATAEELSSIAELASSIQVKQLQKAVEFFKVKAPVSSSVLPDILSDTLKADKEKNSYSA